MSKANFIRKPINVEAIKYVGGSQTFEVGEFIGIENIINMNAFSISFNNSGQNQDISPGEWVVRDLSDASISIYSDEMFSRLFSPVTEGE